MSHNTKDIRPRLATFFELLGLNHSLLHSRILHLTYHPYFNLHALFAQFDPHFVGFFTASDLHAFLLKRCIQHTQQQLQFIFKLITKGKKSSEIYDIADFLGVPFMPAVRKSAYLPQIDDKVVLLLEQMLSNYRRLKKQKQNLASFDPYSLFSLLNYNQQGVVTKKDIKQFLQLNLTSNQDTIYDILQSLRQHLPMEFDEFCELIRPYYFHKEQLRIKCPQSFQIPPVKDSVLWSACTKTDTNQLSPSKAIKGSKRLHTMLTQESIESPMNGSKKYGNYISQSQNLQTVESQKYTLRRTESDFRSRVMASSNNSSLTLCGDYNLKKFDIIEEKTPRQIQDEQGRQRDRPEDNSRYVYSRTHQKTVQGSLEDLCSSDSMLEQIQSQERLSTKKARSHQIKLKCVNTQRVLQFRPDTTDHLLLFAFGMNKSRLQTTEENILMGQNAIIEQSIILEPKIIHSNYTQETINTFAQQDADSDRGAHENFDHPIKIVADQPQDVTNKGMQRLDRVLFQEVLHEQEICWGDTISESLQTCMQSTKGYEDSKFQKRCLKELVQNIDSYRTQIKQPKYKFSMRPCKPRQSINKIHQQRSNYCYQ